MADKFSEIILINDNIVWRPKQYHPNLAIFFKFTLSLTHFTLSYEPGEEFVKKTTATETLTSIPASSVQVGELYILHDAPLAK